MILEYTVKNSDSFYNIKQLLKERFNISEKLLIRLKSNRKIFLNGLPANVKSIIKLGDKIEVYLDYCEDNSNIIAVKMNLDIIYEDSSYIVLNKSAGITTHPSLLHYENSLSNGVKYYFDQINLKKKIRPVNRLDKNTSGLIIFAKNEYIQQCLISQMLNNKFEKIYLGIVCGHITPSTGQLDFPIKREDNSIIKRCVNKDGDKSITSYNVIQVGKDFSIVEFKLQTGRTHQIRVHTSYIGHPIIGDTLYGTQSKLIDRQALHCYKLKFIHPINHNLVEYIAPIPKDMIKIINKTT